MTPPPSANKRLAIRLLIVAVLMVAASFAAVPFYRLFCQITGFGGTALRASQAPAASAVSERMVTVSFNADTDPALPWRFTAPTPNSMKVRIGEAVTVNFTATNQSDKTIVGTSTHSVLPERVSPWVNKLECFCFQEQPLKPGETINLPVTFFVDPEIVKDKNFDDVQAVTLSYTFFLAKDQSKAVKSVP